MQPLLEMPASTFPPAHHPCCPVVCCAVVRFRYAEPISYNFWQHVRKMVDWVCAHWHTKDEGIWETRGGKKDFVYSKVMCWVAVDRGIRLAEKRSFPCQVTRWRQVRDDIYEEVQAKGWNEKRQAYTQSYGSDVLDASVLIMPLVFFVAPTDPRFVSTLQQILQSTTNGGLVSNNLVFRYNTEQSGDGLKGQEGTFSICTFWAVEAAARLGVYRRDYLERSRYTTHHNTHRQHTCSHGRRCLPPHFRLLIAPAVVWCAVVWCEVYFRANVGLRQSLGVVQ